MSWPDPCACVLALDRLQPRYIRVDGEWIGGVVREWVKHVDELYHNTSTAYICRKTPTLSHLVCILAVYWGLAGLAVARGERVFYGLLIIGRWGVK